MNDTSENKELSKEELLKNTNKPENSKKKKLMKWVKYIFLILVAVFLGRYFYNNFDTYKNLDVKINWGVFAAAMLFYFLYLLLYPYSTNYL